MLYFWGSSLNHELFLLEDAGLEWMDEGPQFIDGEPVQRICVNQVENDTLEDVRVSVA